MRLHQCSQLILPNRLSLTYTRVNEQGLLVLRGVEGGGGTMALGHTVKLAVSKKLRQRLKM